MGAGSQDVWKPERVSNDPFIIHEPDQQLPFYLGPQATVRPYTLEVLQIQRIVLVEPGSHHPGRGWLPHLDSRRVSDRCKHAIMLKYERDSWP